MTGRATEKIEFPRSGSCPTMGPLPAGKGLFLSGILPAICEETVDEKTREIVRNLEAEREALFDKFIELSDLAESYNRKAYEVSCRIEAINLALREAMDQGVVDRSALKHEDGRLCSHVPRTIPDEGEEKTQWDLWWSNGIGDEEEGGPPPSN